MKSARCGGLAALAAAVALAVPALAQANEVTKWNNVAMNTVLAQPPIASAPPASGVFMAMVQGAVYGAANAIDRQGRPYLVTRRFPMASMDAAVATAAFHVLDALFPAQHALLQAEYDASLAGMPSGSLKDTGVQVGQAAADAMLTEGHDGRQMIPCAFAAGACVAAAGGSDGCGAVRPEPVGGERGHVHGEQRVAVPHGRAAPIDQRCLRGRVQRGQGNGLAEQHDTDR